MIDRAYMISLMKYRNLLQVIDGVLQVTISSMYGYKNNDELLLANLSLLKVQISFYDQLVLRYLSVCPPPVS